MQTFTHDERATCEGVLDAQRTSIAMLCDPLTEDEARTRLVPSLTCPLALVKHATFVERVWFHHRVAGVPRAQPGLPDTVDESFQLEPYDSIRSTRQAFLDATAISRDIVASHDLEETFDWRLGPVNLRFVYAHMAVELARHAGHGDILVEQLLAQRRDRD